MQQGFKKFMLNQLDKQCTMTFIYLFIFVTFFMWVFIKRAKVAPINVNVVNTERRMSESKWKAME
ncbi:hypothetical protein FON35_10265 [Vibrio parahaemolyticus]|nr:hypothetical protein [Vibrio parahaemolyticus]EGR0314146.1 hypothetical protein [Vibrio parahaemolyticus]EGR1591469.1 hypothetical protein [Vibrio parahaemolyticus]EGR1726577.1 hypothetical protein [Vibrio parahaemolyticus]